MKNVLLIMTIFFGLAVSAHAQASCKPANCAPCPPGCCIINCCTSKGSAADANSNSDSSFALLASFDPAVCGRKMTKKEMKACVASCKKANDATVIAQPAAVQPSPSCNPAPACKSATETSALPVYKASLSKS